MDNLYLLTGDELYEREEFFNKIKNSFEKLERGINYIILDKDSVSSLENEINTYSFGYSKKLIVVKLDKKDDEETENNTKGDFLTTDIENLLSDLDESVCVVFIGNFSSKSKLYKLVSLHGKCYSFEKKKENDLVKWSYELFKENNINISNADLNYFVSLCGTDKLMLKNEINKLLSYAYYSKKITTEDIDKLCIKTSEIIIFDLTDCIGTKNLKRSLVILNELIDNKEPIQKIVIMIERQFKTLLLTKLALEKNLNVMETINAKSPYMVSKYKEQARHFSKEELVYYIKELAKLDVNSKIGKIDLKIGLERILCKKS